MSTTIDSLQIEIQSSSANAAKGIHDLSTALAGLKSNGKITTAVNNLNNLRKALHSFSNIPSNASKILSLAKSLETLKSVGSVTSIGTGLTKLATSLKTLDTVSVDKEKIDKIADSLSSLSQVKAGGINTMMNGLTKLGKVTKSLDDDTINAFAERIEKLTEKLKPLSDKMTTIQAGLKGVDSAARGAGSSIKKAGEEVDGATVNLSGFVYLIQEAVQWLQQAIQKFSEFIAEAIEWDGIAARFGRGFGSQAQEVYTWIQRLNEEMGINIQQFMKYSSVYSTMLTGFGVAMEDATKMALGYTELTYDIWAGYNDIYKNFDDAAEAVKSAIAGEVEPIRRAGFTIVESTLKQTAANHGLEISLENATEAQKSYLRYLTLVDQAHAQGLVGTYAKELQTAEGLMRTAAQQVKSLTQAFGSLFLPILVKIMPYLQAFVELLTDIVHRIAALFGITIQGVDWSGYNSGVSDAVGGTDDLTGSVGEATDAIKELKNATIGIDELNVISPPSSSSSGGAGGGAGDDGFGGLDVDSLWDESIFADIGTQIDEIKRKLEDWMPVISAIGLALGALAVVGLVNSIGDAISKMNLLSKLLSSFVVVTLEAILVFAFADNYLEEGKLMDLIGEALVTAAAGGIMYKGFGPKGAAFAMAISVGAQLVAITMNLADGGVELDDPELWIQTAMTTLTAGAGGLFFFKKIEAIGAKKGAVLGTLIGLSLSLSAVTVGEIASEGRLTFESAMTGLMAAVSTGAAAGQGFKFLGKDPKKGFIIGVATSIALSVASVTASTEDPFGDNLKSTIVNTLMMGASLAGIGATIGGPWGALIGFTLGATLNLVIAGVNAGTDGSGNWATDMVNDLKKKMEEAIGSAEKELAERFGSITLTMEEMEVFVDNVMAIPRNVTIDTAGYEMTVSVSAALEFYAIEKEKLKSLEDSVNAALQEIDHLNLKISLGIEVDPEEYKAAVESFLSASQGLLDQHYLTASVALSVLDLDDTAAGGLSNSLSEFYSANTAKLAELGNKLRDTISSAFVDGEWIPEKLNEAMELQAEIQEILTMVSDAEYEAKLESIKLDINGADLAQGSYDEIMARLQEAVNEKNADLEEIRLDAITVAVLNYEANVADGMTKAEAKKLYNQQVAAIDEAYRQGKVEVSFGAIELGLDTIQEQFKKELAEFSPNFQKILASAIADESLTDYVSNENTYQFARQMYDDMIGQYQQAAYAAVNESERTAILELLAAMTPSLEEYAQVARDAYAAGKSVPKEVRNGLNDAAEIAALTGNRDAINYLIGKGFTTDPVFLNTLATVKNAGKSVTGSMADGFLANVKLVRDAATGTVTGIKNTVTGEVTAMTPELKANLKDMGMDLSAGLEEGVENKKPSLWKKIKGWGSGVLDTLKDVFEINSPSKATQRMGEQLVEGLTMKLKIGTLKDKLSGMWDKAKSWWNNSKGGLNSYTPSIGSIKDKLSSSWTTAKNWWSKSKGSLSYTPTIGSIKDKLSSAWNTAKQWWNKNVKLSIPSLSLKLTYSTEGLSKITKAAMKALGLPGLPKLKFAEHGGIFDVGSLIWAGERGPEVMATAAGGKTGVMNVAQMQDAVYEGVYAAVVAAMRTSGGGEGQAVNVYLDGRQVTAAVEKRQRDRGVSIMGNQIYNYG